LVKYQCNALRKKSDLLTPHSIYTRLGRNQKGRQLVYRGLFTEQIEGKLLEDIRQATNKGLALGNDDFLRILKALLGGELLKANGASQ
jgi:putative transposase